MSKYEEQKHNLSLKLKDICRPYPPLEVKPSKASQPITAFEFHREKTNVEEAKYVHVSLFSLSRYSLLVQILFYFKVRCFICFDVSFSWNTID